MAISMPHLVGVGAPSPSQHSDSAEPTHLHLEVVVNERETGEVVEVVQRGAHFEIDAGILRRLHVLNDRPAGTRVAVDTLPGVTVAYDALRQRLRLQVPAQWFPAQRLDGGESGGMATLSGGTGGLMNYDLYAVRARDRSTTSLWSEQRYFGDAGTISNTGVLRWSDGDHSATKEGYLRYDTRWTRSQQAQATEQNYGDIVTGALRWTTPVRLGGAQWARNFAIRPDIVTHPLPAFAGQAAVPSAVDIFVNGFRSTHHDVQPGPFTLGGVPLVSGAGEAAVVTTDALGRQVYTTVPFYVSTELLRPGLTDYSASVGLLRRGYGLRSFAYGRPVASGVFRRGLTDTLTLEGQAQAGRGLHVLGLGGVTRLGNWGVADASLSYGHAQNHSGWQYSVGYQYYGRIGGIALQHIGRTRGYGDAATYADDGYRLQRRLSQVNLSWSVTGGAVNAGWIGQTDGFGQRHRVAFASYTTALGPRAFLSVMAGRTLNTGDTQLRLQLTYLPDHHSSVQLAAERRDGGAARGHVHYQRSIPPGGGFGWNLGHAGGGDTYQQAALQYRSSYLSAQGGVYGQPSQRALWGQLTGALGWMDGYLFAANRITDGFALVSTQGQADVPVMYENELVGRTDAQGYLLVSNVPSYYRGRYSLDPLGLPLDVHVPALETQATVARGRGTLVTLPVIRMRTATITLVGPDGQPVAAGANVLHEQGEVPTVVGWDGVVYLTVLHPRNTLRVQTIGGGTCHAEFTEAAYQATRDLQVVCHTAPAGPAAQSTGGAS